MKSIPKEHEINAAAGEEARATSRLEAHWLAVTLVREVAGKTLARTLHSALVRCQLPQKAQPSEAEPRHSGKGDVPLAVASTEHLIGRKTSSSRQLFRGKFFEA